MPRIRMTDITGVPYYVTSSDPEVLGKWLWETINRMGPSYMGPSTLYVEPLFNGPHPGVPDWPADMGRAFQAQLHGETPVANVRGLIAALTQYADMEEALQKGKGS